MKYFEVSRKVKVGNTGVAIGGLNSEGLSCGARTGNACRSSVAVRCCTQYNSSDWIMILDGIFQPLHNDGTDSFRLHISIGGYIKGVA